MLITKDEDFPALIVLGQAAPVIIWVRIGNTTRRGLLAWFEPMIDQVVEKVEAGERLIEVR